MPWKVGLSAITMKFIDDPSFIINFPDVFGSFMFGNFNIYIPFDNKLRSVIKILQFFIHTIQ